MIHRCRDIVDLLDRYLEGALDRATAEALEAHLAGCQDCAAFLNTYRSTVRAAGQLKEHRLPADLRDRLRTFLRRQNEA